MTTFLRYGHKTIRLRQCLVGMLTWKHTPDSFACGFFRINFQSRFMRRHESQVDNVRRLMETVLDGREDEALAGLIISANRGYGKEAFFSLLACFGSGSFFEMQDNLLNVRHFVALSYSAI